MQLSSIIAKKKKGDESWNQSKLWFSCNRIIWQIQKKWILHELQQNIFPIIWLISCMHTQHTCSIHESWHKMMMNHELWNSIFFLCVCVCVCVCERERERVTNHVSNGFKLLKWHCSHSDSPWTHFQTHTALYIYTTLVIFKSHTIL